MVQENALLLFVTISASVKFSISAVVHCNQDFALVKVFLKFHLLEPLLTDFKVYLYKEELTRQHNWLHLRSSKRDKGWLRMNARIGNQSWSFLKEQQVMGPISQNSKEVLSNQWRLWDLASLKSAKEWFGQVGTQSTFGGPLSWLGVVSACILVQYILCQNSLLPIRCSRCTQIRAKKTGRYMLNALEMQWWSMETTRSATNQTVRNDSTKIYSISKQISWRSMGKYSGTTRIAKNSINHAMLKAELQIIVMIRQSFKAKL